MLIKSQQVSAIARYFLLRLKIDLAVRGRWGLQAPWRVVRIHTYKIGAKITVRIRGRRFSIELLGRLAY